MFESLLQFVLVSLVGLDLQNLKIPAASAETVIEDSLEVELGKASPYLSKSDLEGLKQSDLVWVVAVLDGDTLLVSDTNRNLFQVRLLAVDTNEINGPDSTAECYGYEAALFTTEFLKNRAVYLRADPANEDKDPYGRTLRYVDVVQEDGSAVSLNEALLMGGYASFPKQYPVTNPGHFEALEKFAQVGGIGMWSACEE